MTKNQTDDDVEFVDALARILNERDLSEIKLTRIRDQNETLRVTVSRPTAASAAVAQVPVAPAASMPAEAAAVAPAAPLSPRQEAAPAAGAAPGTGNADSAEINSDAVTSPMVGTVYLQAEPGAPAFVSEGDRVAEGDTLLIVEAMKTMNQIPAPRAGIVRRVLVEDGAAVEFGTPLVALE